MIKFASGCLLALALSSAAFAQHGVLLQPPPVSFQQKPAPAPPPTPKFDSLAVRGEDGKIVRISGMLEIVAMRNNSLIDEGTIARIRPLVKEWLFEVEQITIDNLDFIEQIQPLDGSPGVIEQLDVNAGDTLHSLSQMMTHLMSAGFLANYLENRGGFTREQSQLNQTIYNDYFQQLMNEVMEEQGLSNDMTKQPKDEQERLKQVNTVTRFAYGMACNDAIQSYGRLLELTAPHVDRAMENIGVSADLRGQMRGSIEGAKGASTPEAKRAGVRQVMQRLSFDQRRALLEQGRELAGDRDPFEAHVFAKPQDQSASTR
jgi:hypothetical protein